MTSLCPPAAVSDKVCDSLTHGLPWPTSNLWQAANRNIALIIGGCGGAFQPLADLARRIHSRIKALDALMEILCRHTCVQCRSLCCRHAQAYFDFKDLLYLHLSREVVPPYQTLGENHPICRFLSSKGCLLPRVQRPFVCTWYICPEQQVHLNQMALSTQKYLRFSIKALKTGRNQLEKTISGLSQVIR